MSTALTRELLTRLITETLADGAFIIAEPADAGTPESEEDVVEATVRFSGPQSGRLLFAGSRAFSEVLAANLLGVEPDDPNVSRRSLDAMGEMLNVLAGVLLESWFGTAASFDSGVPEVRVGWAFATNTTSETAACRTSLLADDQYRIDVTVMVEEGT